MSELNAKTLEYSKQIVDNVKKLDKEGHGATETDFVKGILTTAGVDIANVELYEKEISSLAAAGIHAAGELGLTPFKKNKELSDVTLTMPVIGRNSLHVNIAREKQIVNPQTKETSVKFGHGTVKFDQYSVGTRGEIAKARASVSSKLTGSLSN